jgi:hypothetical protein
MELENNKRKKKGPSRFETGYTSFNPVPKLLTAYYISFLYSIYCQREGILNMASTSFITPFDLLFIDWAQTHNVARAGKMNRLLAFHQVNYFHIQPNIIRSSSDNTSERYKPRIYRDVFESIDGDRTRDILVGYIQLPLITRP